MAVDWGQQLAEHRASRPGSPLAVHFMPDQVEMPWHSTGCGYLSVKLLVTAVFAMSLSGKHCDACSC
jgi:hypothetical protein